MKNLEFYNITNELGYTVFHNYGSFIESEIEKKVSEKWGASLSYIGKKLLAYAVETSENETFETTMSFIDGLIDSEFECFLMATECPLRSSGEYSYFKSLNNVAELMKQKTVKISKYDFDTFLKFFGCIYYKKFNVSLNGGSKNEIIEKALKSVKFYKNGNIGFSVKKEYGSYLGIALSSLMYNFADTFKYDKEFYSKKKYYSELENFHYSIYKRVGVWK
jgi:hypothetical protein